MDELDRVLTDIEARASALRLNALSRAEALARVASRPPSWRVNGVVASDDYGVLAGPKGVGKTFALLDLGVSAALGRPWFGRFETVPCRVLVLTSEDSEARLWRRADAVAASHGVDPGEMDGRLYVHPVPFDAVRDVGLLTAELAAVDPGLVMLDPAYKYLAGASPRSLFDMGQALTPLQLVCQEARAALLVGHHYNRSEGRDREVRISGAGLLEWARLVITMEAPPRRDHGDVTLRFEITGNSLDPLTFTVERSVEALDDSPNPELRYSARVLAQGAEAVAAMYATASDRVLAVLPDSPEDALPIREIGDRVANDATGKGGLKHDTIRRALNRDLGGRVDSVEPGKPGVETRWWRTE